MIDFMEEAVKHVTARQYTRWEEKKCLLLADYMKRKGFEYDQDDGRFTQDGASVLLKRIKISLNNVIFHCYLIQHIFINPEDRGRSFTRRIVQSVCDSADVAKQWLVGSLAPFCHIVEGGGFDDANTKWQPERLKSMMRAVQRFGFQPTESVTPEGKPIVIRRPEFWERNPYQMPPSERADRPLVINCNAITIT